MKPLTQAQIKSFARFVLSTSFSYCEPSLKARFHRDGKRLCQTIANDLGLEVGTYDIRSNVGGIAGSGEVTLHGDHLYLQLQEGITGLGQSNSFMYRGCLGRKDYTGLRNRWATWESLANEYDDFLAGLKSASQESYNNMIAS